MAAQHILVKTYPPPSFLITRSRVRTESRHSIGKWLERNFSSVQSLSNVQLFVTPWTTAFRASLSITSSWSLPKLMSIELVMPSNHLILCRPFSFCPQSFPASGAFPMSQFFATGGQSTGASALASFPPKNTQGSPF